MIENRISKYYQKQYTSKMDESLTNFFKKSKSSRALEKNKNDSNKIMNNFINQSKNNNSFF